MTFEFEANLQSMRAPERPQSAPPVSSNCMDYQESGSSMLPLPPGSSLAAATQRDLDAMSEKVRRLNARKVDAREQARMPTGGPSDYAHQLSEHGSARARRARAAAGSRYRPTTDSCRAWKADTRD